MGDSWRQLPETQKLKYYKEADKLRNNQKQQMADFKQNKLSQVLSDPHQFYWLLNVSLIIHRARFNTSGFGGEEITS